MTGRVIAWRVGLKVAVAAGPVLAVLASGLASALPPRRGCGFSSPHWPAATHCCPSRPWVPGRRRQSCAWSGLGGGSDASLPPALLLAATALVTSHVAAVVLAYGPPIRRLDRQPCAPG